VRLSYALREWTSLAEEYPPARASLIAVRSKAAARRSDARPTWIWAARPGGEDFNFDFAASSWPEIRACGLGLATSYYVV
jgi:hypothetical protein